MRRMSVKQWGWMAGIAAGVLAVLLGTGRPASSAVATNVRSAVPLEFAKLYIEYNFSGNDLGFHTSLDGEDWKNLTIVNPDGKLIFDVDGKGAYAELGMTELFFEGAEPSLDDVPLEVLLSMFPEGDYQFSGKTVDNERIVGVATLTHDIPDAPVITAPDPTVPVDPDHVVIQWDPVTTPPGIQIVAYEIVVENPVLGRSSTFRVPATETSLDVPPQILEADTEHPIEVLAIEVSDNQTIREGSFLTGAR